MVLKELVPSAVCQMPRSMMFFFHARTYVLESPSPHSSPMFFFRAPYVFDCQEYAFMKATERQLHREKKIDGSLSFRFGKVSTCI
jgi:hypothetical protein